ncbi:MAG: hypothetical protein KA746_01355 [Pyrinomonadaceae bacterium]|nr:hypothetical protein [Pyrinomonadaceae bacterium]MBP6211586.1 hypothetical protein [Pyrinomonadaceae bacterium]
MTTPKPEPLIFPSGVRFARKNEMPQGNDKDLARIARANVTTGYIRNDDGGPTFSSYFEANIHAPNVFAVFTELAESLLPDIAAPIIGLKDEEPTFGIYTDLASAIGVFRPFEDLLQNDGFLEFGITFQNNGKIEEIFVKSPKYFTIWTNQPEIVTQVLEVAGIPKCQTLEFIDEYPMVSKSVDKMGNAVWPNVYEALKAAFGRLPIAVLDQ